MTMLGERSAPALTPPDQVPPGPTGTWTVDPSHSSVSLAWRKHRLWTTTGRLHLVGVIHLEALPPVGVIRFDQPSGPPVLTIALDPASIEPHHSDRWWTLHSQSLEILPTGAWRVMATLTANRTPALVELHLEVDPGPEGEPDWLVLRGQGVLDRRAFDRARPVSTVRSQIRLGLALRARRVEGPHPHREER